MKLDWQTAGDVHGNTKSLELWDENLKHIADVTRYDDTNHLKINTFGNELDVATLEQMIALALTHLGDFEDGTPLRKAKTTQGILP